MKKILYFLGALVLVIGCLYFFGPKVQYEPITHGNKIAPIEVSEIDEYLIRTREEGVKTGNESQVIWADSVPTKTKFVLVYLNGFTASKQEGAPINENFAKRYGMNFYYPRLEAHGLIDTNAFEHYTPDAFFDSAEKAIEIAKVLGDSLIIMSCSTGGTLSVLLAGHHPQIHSYIMFSPNIDIADSRSDLMVGPWGKRITQYVLGGDYNNIEYTEEQAKYWYAKYHIDGLIALKYMLSNYMIPENFAKIKEPLFMGYYYKSDKEQDDVVSVSEMLKFYDQVSTPINEKQKISYPEIGRHVICSSYMTEGWQELQSDVFNFAENTLHLSPANASN